MNIVPDNWVSGHFLAEKGEGEGFLAETVFGGIDKEFSFPLKTFLSATKRFNKTFLAVKMNLQERRLTQ